VIADSPLHEFFRRESERVVAQGYHPLTAEEVEQLVTLVREHSKPSLSTGPFGDAAAQVSKFLAARPKVIAAS
jgi:hypothetical protein